MSDTQAQFSVLRQTADPAVVDANSQLIAEGDDRDRKRRHADDGDHRHSLLLRPVGQVAFAKGLIRASILVPWAIPTVWPK